MKLISTTYPIVAERRVYDKIINFLDLFFKLYFLIVRSNKINFQDKNTACMKITRNRRSSV